MTRRLGPTVSNYVVTVQKTITVTGYAVVSVTARKRSTKHQIIKNSVEDIDAHIDQTTGYVDEDDNMDSHVVNIEDIEESLHQVNTKTCPHCRRALDEGKRKVFYIGEVDD